MSLLNRASYFEIENPLRALERWRHRPRYRQSVVLQGREVEIDWTRRADDELVRRETPLCVELRLYFSCLVKKQLFFHQGPVELASTRVNDRLALAFRPFTAAACDPVEFATHYPAGRDLSDGVAAGWVPRRVTLDYRKGQWQGRFGY